MVKKIKNMAELKDEKLNLILEIPQMEPKEYLAHLQLDFDMDSQLKAIREQLYVNYQASKNSDKRIQDTVQHAEEASGIMNEYYCNRYLEAIHHSSYQSAAHSMTAVGMLAPFIETVYFQIYKSIGEKICLKERSHPRVLIRKSFKKWDVHYKYTGKKKFKNNLVQGILQITQMLGVDRSMPKEFSATLEALFEYRNKMFHCGFEWPLDERKKFEKRILSWPKGWFESFRIDNRPWIFCMTDTFIKKVFDVFDASLIVLGKFVNEHIE